MKRQSIRTPLRRPLRLPDPACPNAHGADHFPVALQRNSAGENDNAAASGRMDSEEPLSGLAFLRKILRWKVERKARVRLVYSGVDAANPGTVHADVRHKVPS
jgi:hypothetical protein